MALGLNALVPRLKSVKPATKVILGRLVPFAAVASAGALNVFLMRGEEMRVGIDVYRSGGAEDGEGGGKVDSLGKSKKAATIAVAETALSRVLNSTPIMVLPPLVLVRLQRTEWLKQRPRMVLPVNLGEYCEREHARTFQVVNVAVKKTLVTMLRATCIGLILTTSIFALPLALAAFPQRQAVLAKSLEEEFWEKGGKDGKVEFNRGI